MSLIRVEGLDTGPVVAGLEWETIPVKELGHRKKEARLDNKLVFSQKIRAGGGKLATFGTQPNPEYDGTKKLVSLAAWLNASTENNTVFALEKVHELTSANDDGERVRYWFCLVNAGEIIQGTDIVADLETVKMLALDIASAVDPEDRLFVGNAAQELDIYEAGDDNPPPISEVLVPGKLKTATLQAKSNSKAITVIALSLVLLSAVVGGGYAYYAQLAEEEAAKQRAQERQRQQIENAKREWAETLENAKKMAEGEFTLHAVIRDKVLKFRPNIISWRLAQLECATGQCQVTYANDRLSRTEFVTETVQPRCETFTINRAGIEATCVFSYPEKPEVVDITNRQWLLTEAQWTEFRTDIMNLARLNNDIAYSFGEKNEISFPGKSLVRNAKLFDVASYSIDLPLSSYEAVESLFEKFPGMSVTKMEVTGGKNNLTISGLLYQEIEK